MNAFSKSRVGALALGIVAILVLAAFSPALTQGSSQLVAPPNSNPYGKSYAAWSEAWWQWAYGLPVDGHPLFDETGANAAAGQSGPVWFLGGVFNVSGTAVRSITVPKGTALFFPILNVEWDNVCPPTDPPLTIDELRDIAAYYTDLTTDLACEVDGVPVADPFGFRTTAGPFSVTVPEGNIWQLFCGVPPAGTYSPLMGDGHYIMLWPLSKGHHTLHFAGTIGPPIGFSLDITYDIEVVDRHGALAAGAATASPLSKANLAWVVEAMKAARTGPVHDGVGAIEAAISPNPMRDHGTLRFALSKPGQVGARLFDVSGRVVRVLAEQTFLPAGTHELRVDLANGADHLVPGTYFYAIRTPEGIQRGRITIVE